MACYCVDRNNASNRHLHRNPLGRAAASPENFFKKSLDKHSILWYIIVMKRDTREMLEITGIIIAAVIAAPVAIFVLVMLLSL